MAQKEKEERQEKMKEMRLKDNEFNLLIDRIDRAFEKKISQLNGTIKSYRPINKLQESDFVFELTVRAEKMDCEQKDILIQYLNDQYPTIKRHGFKISKIPLIPYYKIKAKVSHKGDF